MEVGTPHPIVNRIACLGIALLASACASFETSTAARQQAAALLNCPEARVELESTDEYRYLAHGCGEQIELACSALALEPTCLRIQPRTAGGIEAPRSVSNEIPPAEATFPAIATTNQATITRDETENAASVPLTPAAITESRADSLRAQLNAQRENILTCVGTPRIAIRLTLQTDGDVTIDLMGPLQSSPEEGCVRNVLEGLVLPEPSPSPEALIHLIQSIDAPSEDSSKA